MILISLKRNEHMKLFYFIADSFVKTKAGMVTTALIYKIYEFLRFRRSLQEHTISTEKLKYLFNDLTVRTGFMKGLKYPGFSSYGSSIFPKLSGTYEGELNQVFLQLKETNYSFIIDVGCAEGFYAVGLAKQFNEAKVFAFDLSEKAQELCKGMAELNNVIDRVNVNQECTSENLTELVNGQRSLIICDCEGYERQLFNMENVASLGQSDLIIELHPMHEKDVKEYLYQLFVNSHTVEYYTSYDDRRKIFDLHDSYFVLSEIDKIKLVQEGRAFSMDWMIAKAKYIK
jgi:hypothetical protein